MISPAEATVLLFIVCGHALKVTVAYVFCGLIASITTSPAMRFIGWLPFFVFSVEDSIFCIAQLFATHLSARGSGSPAGTDLHSVSLSVPVMQVIERGLKAAILIYLSALLSIVLLGAWKRIQLARALHFRVHRFVHAAGSR